MRKEMLVITLFLTFIALFLASPYLTLAEPVPDTGQTKCYDDAGAEITCPSPGEPFYGQDAQYIIYPKSYTKLDASGNDLPDDEPWPWAMVRDNVTGLVWEVKTDDSTVHDRDNTYNWWDARDVFIADLNTNNFGGYNDWRMPTIKELSFIVNSDTYSPSIDQSYFPNTVLSYYWSSNTWQGATGGAWYVDFISGRRVSVWGKSIHDSVRAVRGGQCGSFDNYIDNGDGTVSDLATGLMWQQATAPGTYTWEGALTYCEGLNFAGYDDWRLPNRNELQSIVDYSTYNPAIDTTYFPDTMSSFYWSSTTYVGKTYFARDVDFDYGFVGNTNKSIYYYVRAVHVGQCGLFGDSDDDGICDDGDNNGTPGDNPCTGGEQQAVTTTAWIVPMARIWEPASRRQVAYLWVLELLAPMMEIVKLAKAVRRTRKILMEMV